MHETFSSTPKLSVNFIERLLTLLKTSPQFSVEILCILLRIYHSNMFNLDALSQNYSTDKQINQQMIQFS